VVIYLVYRNAKKMQQAIDNANKPIVSYAGYLNKLCLMTNKSTYDIFYIAAEPHKIPKWMVEKDFSNWIKKFGADDKMPNYVKEFLDEGKEIIEEAYVNPFTWTSKI